MDIFHFCIPFCFNIISALCIIIITARTRSTARKDESYKQHMLKQLRQHKHTIISPFILILLALPRLIISFLSGCMKSARNPWIFIIGYFISLISSASMFAVFILPSELYRRSFQESMEMLYSNTRRQLGFQ